MPFYRGSQKQHITAFHSFSHCAMLLKNMQARHIPKNMTSFKDDLILMSHSLIIGLKTRSRSVGRPFSCQQWIPKVHLHLEDVKSDPDSSGWSTFYLIQIWHEEENRISMELQQVHYSRPLKSMLHDRG